MLTRWEFEEAKKHKMEEVAYIASEIIALSAVEEKNFSLFEEGKSLRFFLLRDNSGFGDKRKWCMKLMEKTTGMSKIFCLAQEKSTRDWVSATMEMIPKILDELEYKILSEKH